ncbi:hypothetical protein ZWY2020_005431 [Hordeum vulgare]|nr:hypothetical protein ZWY2020_005431 [Hordeum vulgare]
MTLPPSDAECTSGKCGYTYTYGDSSTQRPAARPSRWQDEAPDIALLRRPNRAMGSRRLVGWAALSLVSQLGLNKFSYCLTSLDDTSKSPLLLGSLATISESAAAASSVQTTPLIRNRASRPSTM